MNASLVLVFIFGICTLYFGYGRKWGKMIFCFCWTLFFMYPADMIEWLLRLVE